MKLDIRIRWLNELQRNWPSTSTSPRPRAALETSQSVRVLTTVTSHTNNFHERHEMCVVAFGRLPSPRRVRPTGSLVTSMRPPTRRFEGADRSVAAAVCDPVRSLFTSINAAQLHLWRRQRPRRDQVIQKPPDCYFYLNIHCLFFETSKMIALWRKRNIYYSLINYAVIIIIMLVLVEYWSSEARDILDWWGGYTVRLSNMSQQIVHY